MDIVWIIYLIEVAYGLDMVSEGLIALCIFSFAPVIVYYVANIHRCDDADALLAQSVRQGRLLLVAFFILCTIQVFVPSKEGMYTMLAAAGVTAAVNTDAAQRLVPKSVELLEKYMDEQLASD